MKFTKTPISEILCKVTQLAWWNSISHWWKQDYCRNNSDLSKFQVGIRVRYKKEYFQMRKVSQINQESSES